MKDKNAVFFENGIPDVNISKISSCSSCSMSECEKKCARYYHCDTIALAEDILKEYEKGERK